MFNIDYIISQIVETYRFIRVVINVAYFFLTIRNGSKIFGAVQRLYQLRCIRPRALRSRYISSSLAALLSTNDGGAGERLLAVAERRRRYRRRTVAAR